MSFKRVHLPIFAAPGEAALRDARLGPALPGSAVPGTATRGRAARSNPRRGLSIREAKEIAGTLGQPSKLPGFSYGISAKLCNIGSKLRGVPGSVCSSCYARTDFYETWRPLLEGHEKRERGIRHPRWVKAMTTLIDRYCVAEQSWFRWHDSGDLRGLWHLENIVEVCWNTPNVRHWLPTREYDVVSAFLASGGTFPDNLCVRLSGHMIDQDPVLPPELVGFPTSTVSSVSLIGTGFQLVEGKGSVECRAVEARDNKCGSCRACWHREVRNISYPQH